MKFTKKSYSTYIGKIGLIEKHVTLEKLKELEDAVNIIVCKKGQQFLMEGALVDGLFFVCKGKAKVLKTGIYGKEQILRFVGKGEMVGHRGYGTRKRYGISAVALEECVLCHFSNEAMDNLLNALPDLTYDLMLFYADELNRSETKVKALAQMTVREKVIDSLLYIDRKFGRNPKGYLNIQLSRKEIAEYTGTTEEQVIRTISALKKENLLLASGKQLAISEADKLKKEIQEHNYFLDT